MLDGTSLQEELNVFDEFVLWFYDELDTPPKAHYAVGCWKVAVKEDENLAVSCIGVSRLGHSITGNNQKTGCDVSTDGLAGWVFKGFV
ncbi:hypothetical protein CEXT_761901 [Caerostris extrusa]|uniref:Uncharacterized protein n=1 Tax=Caerostris extrusa TaxID=172846 RepID=A0AAV4XMP3_CAEEX|nr:hypothetical protein CEXT_761901 [Caerostris extrusa]